MNSKFKDFEDGIQNFAAVQNREIDVILTRNIKDFIDTKVNLLNPWDYSHGHMT